MRRYKVTLKDGVQRAAHRVIWERENGPIPPGYEIHHRNGDGYDNRIENLQMLTRSEHKQLHARLRKLGQDVVDPNDPRVVYAREGKKLYRQRHLEECKERDRRYYLEHKEACDARKRAWAAENKDKVSASGKRSYLKHKAAINAKHREYRASHREQALAYAKKYNDEHRAEHMAYNAAHRDEKHTYNISYYESHKELIKVQTKLYRAIKSGKSSEVVDSLRDKLNQLRKEQQHGPAQQ